MECARGAMKTGERQERWQRIRLEQIEEDMKREEEIDGIGEHRHRRPCFLHVGVEEEGLGAPPPVRLHGGGVLAAKAHVLPRVHIPFKKRVDSVVMFTLLFLVLSEELNEF
jgi:hypothetical protein